MDKERLIIEAKRRGDDGYKTFSIRIRQELVEKLDTLSATSGYSRNELIGILLEYAAGHCEVKENTPHA